jgi:hypothetical protein
MFGFKKEQFTQEFFLAHDGQGHGQSADAPLPLVDADLMALPAGAIVEKCFVIVDEAIAGTSALEVGDDDDADGFVTNASVTLGTPGMYGYASAAAYLASGAAKYYAAAGKELKLNVTGVSSAGKARVIVQGYLASK